MGSATLTLEPSDLDDEPRSRKSGVRSGRHKRRAADDSPSPSS